MRKICIMLMGTITAMGLPSFGMENGTVLNYCLKHHPDLIYDYSKKTIKSKRKRKKINLILSELPQDNVYLPALILKGEKLLTDPQRQSKENGVTVLQEALHLDYRHTRSLLNEKSLLLLVEELVLLGEKSLKSQSQGDRKQGILALFDAARLDCRRACSLLSKEYFKQNAWEHGMLWLLAALRPLQSQGKNNQYDSEALAILEKVRGGDCGSLAKEALNAIENNGYKLHE